MILAGLDIGTNTLRLLVAETGPDYFHEIFADRKITRLGQDLDRTGMLAGEAEERSLKVLGGFSEHIRRHAAIHTAAIGTSALRKASNARQFIETVKKRSGISIKVISGEEEGRLTLLGVAQALTGGGLKNNPLQSACIVDIGGGSTEIMLTRGSVSVMESLPLGAVYLTERFLRHDPPSTDEVQMLRGEVRAVLAQHAGTMNPEPGGVFVGTAGTITTLASMEQRLAEYSPDKINRYPMSRDAIDGLVRKLGMATLEERRSFAGLERGREDIIFAGAVVAQEIMIRFGFTTMIVSDWGLREGIVLDLYRKSI